MLYASFDILYSNKINNLCDIVDEEGNMQLTYACLLNQCFQIVSVEMIMSSKKKEFPDKISLENLALRKIISVFFCRATRSL